MTIKIREIKAVLEDPEDPEYVYRRQMLFIRPKEHLEFGRISLDINGWLEIKSGYVYDFASGALDDDSIKEASLVHDALCELIHNDVLSYHQWDEAADDMQAVMREYAEIHGGWWGFRQHARRIRAAYITQAIKLAGPRVTVDRIYRTI